MRNVDNRWPPEPKVSGSNPLWRAKNARKAPAQPCTKTHESAQADRAGHTDKRQGIAAAHEPLPGRRPRQPHCYHTPAGDVWSWTWIAVALASALALVALTGCDDGPCVETIHSMGWWDDGACYDKRARPELIPGANAFRCVCPVGAK